MTFWIKQISLNDSNVWPDLEGLFPSITHSALYMLITQRMLVIWMICIRIGNPRQMCCWKPMVFTANPPTACCLCWIWSPIFLSTVQIAMWTGCVQEEVLYYANFRRKLHSENLWLSIIHSPGPGLVWRMTWLQSLLLKEMGRKGEAGISLCEAVIWPPAERVRLMGGNLANSFPAGFCTPERIIFFNSSIQRGGTIFKFT